ncbi:hypothetical protein [Arthrobacter sp. efr-133-R2A-120]|uniref:hypothetical protein n=1 Tax=Arthrobacter sp. efr-133-R2A-120 TaxID=3040277 RepID=UPI002551B56A|nr:hypothetical protein [Arthrobacter sp. efr-133-R2A-120]
MSHPRYIPRSYAAHPHEFGKVEHLRWPAPELDTDRDLASAAHLQHYFSHRILNRLSELGLSLREYASMTGQNYDRVIKVYRGNTVLKIEEVFRAERLLGDVIDPDGTPFHQFAQFD